MSYPNETTEMWREVHQAQAEARARRKEANLAVLRASSLPFIYKNNNDHVMVRDARFPAMDFWPATNHWKAGNRNIKGSAEVLIEWLERLERKPKA